MKARRQSVAQPVHLQKSAHHTSAGPPAAAAAAMPTDHLQCPPLRTMAVIAEAGHKAHGAGAGCQASCRNRLVGALASHRHVGCRVDGMDSAASAQMASN